MEARLLLVAASLNLGSKFCLDAINFDIPKQCFSILKGEYLCCELHFQSYLFYHNFEFH